MRKGEGQRKTDERRGYLRSRLCIGQGLLDNDIWFDKDNMVGNKSQHTTRSTTQSCYLPKPLWKLAKGGGVGGREDILGSDMRDRYLLLRHSIGMCSHYEQHDNYMNHSLDLM